MEEARTDFELMQAIAQNDMVAFRMLVERHQGLVYGTVVKMLGDPIEAEDIAQEVFLRVYRAAKTYEPTAQFKTWLFTIVRNLVFNEQRRRSKAKFESILFQSVDGEIVERDLIDKGQKDAAYQVLNDEYIEAINQAILELPELQRLAVIMRRYDEFSYEEIAKVLHTTVSATKSLLFRARETLREKLKNYLEEEN